MAKSGHFGGLVRWAEFGGPLPEPPSYEAGGVKVSGRLGQPPIRVSAQRIALVDARSHSTVTLDDAYPERQVRIRSVDSNHHQQIRSPKG